MSFFIGLKSETYAFPRRLHRTVHVYRPGRSPEILENPDFVSCDPELPGFALQMARFGEIFR